MILPTSSAMKNVQEAAKCTGTPLLKPSIVKQALHLDPATQAKVQRNRDAVRDILSQPAGPSENDRLLVIVGPCSIHDPDAALEYASLLAKAADQYHRELVIAMRVYVEKPRTAVGWKGLIHDPDHGSPQQHQHKNPSHDVNKGVHVSRKVMLNVARMGLPVATELLNPLLVSYFADLVSVGVVGARTTESQTHREMCSDMPMPVGYKNGTDCGVRVALDAMAATSRPHTVVGFDEEGDLSYRLSRGNPDTFMILRGGSQGPNFGPEQVRAAEHELARAGKKPCIVVDCSHGNSMKDYRNQGKVAGCVADQIAAGAPIMGVMIESNINEGRQDVPDKASSQPLKYGVSITDGCIGWLETEEILGRLAAAVRERQASCAPMVTTPHAMMVTASDLMDVKIPMKVHEREISCFV